jgi:heat shock protein HslJ
MNGTYSLDGDMITFSALASTRMAGAPEAMKLEDGVGKTLAGKLRYSITGDVLELWRGESLVAKYTKAAP